MSLPSFNLPAPALPGYPGAMGDRVPLDPALGMRNGCTYRIQGDRGHTPLYSFLLQVKSGVQAGTSVSSGTFWGQQERTHTSSGRELLDYDRARVVDCPAAVRFLFDQAP